MQDQREIQLIFDPGRGTVGLRAITAIHGDRVGAMPTATRRGYVFLGWYTAAEGGRPIASETEVSEDTVGTGDSITLYARWKKEDKRKNRSSLKTQKRAVVILAAVAVLLVVGLLVVNYVVSIYHYPDTDGTVYTIKKSGGIYGLYLDGERCDVNEQGYFLTRAGTQLELDADTGAYEVYAVVHTSDTEEVGNNRRVLLFKQLTYDAGSTKDTSRIIRRIEVQNQYGKTVFLRPEAAADGTQSNYFYMEDYPSTVLDNTLFAQLASGCGYNLSERRLKNPVRLADGSVDFAEYGLLPETRTREDEEGNEEVYDYVPTYYTVTTMNGDRYTVTLGDATVTGGYYARFTDFNGQGGRDTIYVLTSANLDNAVLQPVETLVTPRIVYPMGQTDYYNVENFNYYTDINYDKLLRNMILELTDGEVDLDTVELDPDTDQLPVEVTDRINAALLALDEMEDEDYKTFYDRHYAAVGHLVTSFSAIPLDEREDTLMAHTPYVMSGDIMEGYRPNSDNISSYVLYNLYKASFEKVVKLGPSSADLEKYGLDNPAHVISFIYHETVAGSQQPVDQYNLVHFSDKQEDGYYYAYSPIYDMIVAVAESEVPYLTWEPIDWYEREYFLGNILYTTDIFAESSLLDDPLHFRLDFSSVEKNDNGAPTSVDGLKIFANEKLINYDLMVHKPVDEYVEETSLYNFQRLYVVMASGSLEETADLTEEEMAALRAQDDSACLLKLTFFQDDRTGAADGTRYLVYRFYQVSERRVYMTLEVLDAPDLSLSNPENAQGLFYASASYCKKIVADINRYLTGEEITIESKT